MQKVFADHLLVDVGPVVVILGERADQIRYVVGRPVGVVELRPRDVVEVRQVDRGTGRGVWRQRQDRKRRSGRHADNRNRGPATRVGADDRPRLDERVAHAGVAAHDADQVAAVLAGQHSGGVGDRVDASMARHVIRVGALVDRGHEPLTPRRLRGNPREPVDLVPGGDGGVAQCDEQVTFARPGRTDQTKILGLGHPFQAGQVVEGGLRHGRRGDLELVERLGDREAGAA